MKRMIPLLCLVAISAYSQQDSFRLYKELAKRAGYKGDSFLEIAIKRNDAQAIQTFIYRSTLPELKQARKTLSVQRSAAQDDIRRLAAPVGPTRDIIDTRPEQNELRYKIRWINNLLAQLNGRIASMQ